MGRDLVGHDVTGAIFLGHSASALGLEVSRAGRHGAKLRGPRRHWGNIPGAGGRGAEGSGPGHRSPATFKPTLCDPPGPEEKSRKECGIARFDRNLLSLDLLFHDLKYQHFK